MNTYMNIFCKLVHSKRGPILIFIDNDRSLRYNSTELQSQYLLQHKKTVEAVHFLDFHNCIEKYNENRKKF